MHGVAITGTGVYTPSQTITNDELVAAFNAYADLWNAENAAAIAAGTVPAKEHSSSEFIVAASGIEQRHVLEKDRVSWQKSAVMPRKKRWPLRAFRQRILIWSFAPPPIWSAPILRLALKSNSFWGRVVLPSI